MAPQAIPDRPAQLLEVHETASGAGKLITGSENPVQEQIPGFTWTAKEFGIAVLKGVSQVTFVENWVTGAFWVVGLTLSFELVGGRVFTNAFTTGWDPGSPLFLARADGARWFGNRCLLRNPRKIPDW